MNERERRARFWVDVCWLAIFACGVAVVLIFAGSARSATPRPECAPPAKPHCRIHYVSYSYIQNGRDQFGNHYVRTCHVPAHGKRWCGPWRVAP